MQAVICKSSLLLSKGAMVSTNLAFEQMQCKSFMFKFWILHGKLQEETKN
jgi:hypothetical protein